MHPSTSTAPTPAGRRFGLALALALVAALGVPGSVDAQEHGPAGIPSTMELAVRATQEFLAGRSARSLGPLRISERNPLYHLFLTPVMRGAEVAEAGEVHLQVANAYSNIFELNASPIMSQRFDLERLSTAMTLLVGVVSGVEMGVQVGVQHSWSGFLDPLIQGVHTTFGFPNADREKVPNNQYQVRLTGPEGREPVYLDLPGGTALEAPRVLVGWRLFGSSAASSLLTLRGIWKLPVGEAPASSGRSDGALMLAFRQRWGSTHLHLSAGGVALNPTAELEPLVRRRAILGSVAVEQRLTPGFGVVAQFAGGSRYTRLAGFKEFDRPPVNFSVGAAGRLSRWEWQVSFTEDLPANSPAVDFTLDVQISRRWGGLDLR